MAGVEAEADAGSVVTQVLAKNLLETNELLKTHQTQVQTLLDQLKAVEDEKALITEKWAIAQHQITASDISRGVLKQEVSSASA